MVRKIDWESQIGRRLRLRDLHVFFTVAQRGSMAKAAAQLGVSQPAVSEVIGDLEHALGVRLLDRSAHGVEPTVYGRALLKRGTAAFDELRQSIRDIEFLADPTVGKLQIGCPESLGGSILAPSIEQFSKQYPRVILHVERLTTPTLELRELRERSLDVVLARVGKALPEENDDLNVRILFDDRLIVAAGTHSRWAHRRKIDLVELANEPWILTPPNSWNDLILREAFRERGLPMPAASLVTLGLNLRAHLLATGPFITTLPMSALSLHAYQSSLKALPVELPARPWPVAIVTLKNRTLSPVVQLFIDHLHVFAGAMAAGLKTEQKSA
jgi:DNA-binding transcriptional LysR family regulator